MTAHTLVVEDDPDTQEAVVAMLEELGRPAASVAANGVEAIEHLKQSPSGLMMLDLMMPRMDGFELLREIRAGTAPRPGKIICIGMNYRDKRAEWAHDKETPNLFIRFSDSQVGHGQPIVKPRVSDQLDFEGELALIVGKAGRHIPQERALAHLAGYACYLDGSVRDWQQHSVAAGKNFPSTGGFGPWMVTTDEIPDPTRMTLITRLNGREMQRATTDQLIFSIPFILNYVSAFTPLAPGYVISTGSPAGVGARRGPPAWP